MENKGQSLEELLKEAQEIIWRIEEEEDGSDAPQFGLPEYWDERYSKEEEDTYEWFVSWTEVNKRIDNLFKDEKFDKALNLGCGNSPMFLQIENFFNDVYNIDISGVIIEKLSKKYKDNKSQHWNKMDCAKLEFPDLFFDVVFDKATLDAIYCGDDPMTNVIKSLTELFRVLKVGGLFVEITCGLIMPFIKKGSQFRGKILHFEMIHSDKFLSPTNEGQIVYLFIFRKIDSDYDENGCDDDELIHKNDDDFIGKLVDDDINKDIF